MTFFRKNQPKISIVVIFYNMQREAKRTLLSLTLKYQRGVSEKDYEVLAIDNASSEPLEAAWVQGFQGNFRYYYVDSKHPSPCAAINQGVDLACGKNVVCLVDGARILSPGILHGMIRGFNAVPNAYIHTLGFHLGTTPQYQSIHQGYCQKVEDQLLKKVTWEEDGYQLFDISSPAASAKGGYFSNISESNCFGVKKNLFTRLGGYEEGFISKGGGMCNLEMHKRMVAAPELEPVLLLGEGTFHQFHGGIATNAECLEPVLEGFAKEYIHVTGEVYSPVEYSPCYFGRIHPKTARFIKR
jgi:hypothetical protein